MLEPTGWSLTFTAVVVATVLAAMMLWVIDFMDHGITAPPRTTPVTASGSTDVDHDARGRPKRGHAERTAAVNADRPLDRALEAADVADFDDP